MLSEWIMEEHHRLHIVEQWPDGAYKEVVLAAIRSTLHSLLLDSRAAVNPPVCAVCNERRGTTAVLDSFGARWSAADHQSLAD
jgi:hypothetical protein